MKILEGNSKNTGSKRTNVISVSTAVNPQKAQERLRINKREGSRLNAEATSKVRGQSAQWEKPVQPVHLTGD